VAGRFDRELGRDRAIAEGRHDEPARGLSAIQRRPYSERATLTEYFDVAPHGEGGQLLVLTTIVDDPQYLQRPFIVSSHFKKESDGSKWSPTPCTARW
jgi:hypothetical protein